MVVRRRSRGCAGATKVIALSVDADLLQAIDALSSNFQLSRSSVVERLVRLGLRLLAIDYEGEVKEA